MKPLPLPVRIAAGLAATAVEQARHLPRLVIELPVTAVSQALQASMRVQQKVTELAIKGDRVLGVLRPVEEKPSWATFDDEEPARRNGASTVTELRPQAAPTPVAQPPRRTERPAAPRRTATSSATETSERTPGSSPAAASPSDVAAEVTAVAAASPSVAPGGTSTAPHPEDPTPGAPAVEANAAAQAEATPAAPATPPPVTAIPNVPPAPAAPTATAAKATPTSTEERSGDADDSSGPNLLPGYADMTIAQLRARLRRLSVDDLRALLEWETAHANRPPFVTMLTNRITTVTAG